MSIREMRDILNGLINDCTRSLIKNINGTIYFSNHRSKRQEYHP